MPKFVVYEIWTRAHVVEAATESQALAACEPKPRRGLSLSNWHAQEVIERRTADEVPASGALNYRQV